ncbi:hypothetical protein P9112_006598 [Eukaryota sp. TZLM1-RC]
MCEEDASHASCRVCHCPSSDLISPCNCTGSLAYIHRECLEQWLMFKKIALFDARCEVCLSRYSIPIKLTLTNVLPVFFSKISPKLLTFCFLFLQFSCVCLFFITPHISQVQVLYILPSCLALLISLISTASSIYRPFIHVFVFFHLALSCTYLLHFSFSFSFYTYLLSHCITFVTCSLIYLTHSLVKQYHGSWSNIMLYAEVPPTLIRFLFSPRYAPPICRPLWHLVFYGMYGFIFVIVNPAGILLLLFTLLIWYSGVKIKSSIKNLDENKYSLIVHINAIIIAIYWLILVIMINVEKTIKISDFEIKKANSWNSLILFVFVSSLILMVLYLFGNNEEIEDTE